jgi:hypothetical protein
VHGHERSSGSDSGKAPIARGNGPGVNHVPFLRTIERVRFDEKRVSAGSSALLMRCAFDLLKRGAMVIETEAQDRAGETPKALTDG